MTEHAAAPWYIADHLLSTVEVRDRAGGLVADVWGDAPSNLALNSALIVAAPDLLVALQKMIDEFNKFARYGSSISHDANAAMRAARDAVKLATTQVAP